MFFPVSPLLASFVLVLLLPLLLLLAVALRPCVAESMRKKLQWLSGVWIGPQTPGRGFNSR